MRSVLARTLLRAACLGILAAALPAAPALAAKTKVAALDETVVTAVTSAGKRHRYTVEVARTEAQQARGLMYRKSMPRDRGMIFPFQPARYASFWMENTYIPLDIIFIGTDRRVLNIVQGKPKSRDILNSIGPAIAVLELNAGESDRIGLEPGDLIEGSY